MMTVKGERASYQLKQFNDQRKAEIGFAISSGAFGQFDRFQAEAVPVIAAHIQRASEIALLATKQGDTETASLALMIVTNCSFDLTRAYERDEA
ncbi:hypothetical protein [Staphylococcus aureus]|uniref:hypothetical protein n=1 Tax=Staphylococcus aureus TaxID=1280 RepID=UPI0020C0891A|nr:hypothetical protein [Staphylococcus aureus]